MSAAKRAPGNMQAGARAPGNLSKTAAADATARGAQLQREYNLNGTQKAQVKMVCEVKPDWTDEAIVSFCAKHNYIPSVIDTALTNAFEDLRPSEDQSAQDWSTTTKKPRKKKEAPSGPAANGKFKQDRPVRGGSTYPQVAERRTAISSKQNAPRNAATKPQSAKDVAAPSTGSWGSPSTGTWGSPEPVVVPASAPVSEASMPAAVAVVSPGSGPVVNPAASWAAMAKRSIEKPVAATSTFAEEQPVSVAEPSAAPIAHDWSQPKPVVGEVYPESVSASVKKTESSQISTPDVQENAPSSDVSDAPKIAEQKAAEPESNASSSVEAVAESFAESFAEKLDDTTDNLLDVEFMTASESVIFRDGPRSSVEAIQFGDLSIDASPSPAAQPSIVASVKAPIDIAQRIPSVVVPPVAERPRAQQPPPQQSQQPQQQYFNPSGYPVPPIGYGPVATHYPIDMYDAQHNVDMYHSQQQQHQYAGSRGSSRPTRGGAVPQSYPRANKPRRLARNDAQISAESSMNAQQFTEAEVASSNYHPRSGSRNRRPQHQAQPYRGYPTGNSAVPGNQPQPYGASAPVSQGGYAQYNPQYPHHPQYNMQFYPASDVPQSSGTPAAAPTHYGPPGFRATFPVAGNPGYQYQQSSSNPRFHYGAQPPAEYYGYTPQMHQAQGANAADKDSPPSSPDEDSVERPYVGYEQGGWQQHQQHRQLVQQQQSATRDGSPLSYGGYQPTTTGGTVHYNSVAPAPVPSWTHQ